jgi:hypothetical protein
MTYFIPIYLGILLLKILGVPRFREIGWGWFVLAPIIWPVLQLLWFCLTFVFWAAVGIAGVYGIAQLVIWATEK